MTSDIASFEIHREEDVVLTRQRARHLAAAVGFDEQDQVRIATAVSEVARSALVNAGGGRIAFGVEGDEEQSLVARVVERGPGRNELSALLDGRHSSPEDLGFGLIAARRLMDRFEISSSREGGAAVRIAKLRPKHLPRLSPQEIRAITLAQAGQKLDDPFGELRRQNQELLQALAELRERQTELAQLNRELEETNRGVVALYAELDEKADSLRRASELKSRFLSNISHEFRSPLNSILSLSRFLLDRTDGELTEEQEKQVAFISKAADGLLALVNDLLDLAKVESGKVVVYAEPFDLANLFSTLRGMFRPLVTSDDVALLFDDPAGRVELETDEGKLSQIVRNFLSNAVKFTERGEIRVSADLAADEVTITVTDNGIGIASDDCERIFEEFSQIESVTQRRVKGTGLGLPLSRKLAELLGGTVSVESQLGRGSRFSVTIPRYYSGPDRSSSSTVIQSQETSRRSLLLVEDDPATRYLYEKHLENSEFRVVPAVSIAEARRALRGFRPDVVVLDIILNSESGWELLSELKTEANTRDIPVLVITIVDEQERARELGADDFCAKPVERECLLERLRAVFKPRQNTLLIVDDDELARYVLRNLLMSLGFNVLEASSGTEGLKLAQAELPQAIFLDLAMPELSGYEVLEQLKHDVRTESIPVVVHTSQVLDDAVLSRLANAAAVLSKEGTSRDFAEKRLREVLFAIGLLPSNEESNGSGR